MSDFVLLGIGLLAAWMVAVLILLNECRDHLRAMASQPTQESARNAKQVGWAVNKSAVQRRQIQHGRNEGASRDHQVIMIR